MNRPAHFSIALLACCLVASSAAAAVKTQTVEYKEGDTPLAGYLAYDDALPGKRPAVLVVHEWMGLNDYAKKRAEQLAAMGYVAFAADIYGKDVKVKDVEEAKATSGKFKADRPLLRARVTAALKQLKKQENVDASKIAAIGYCFGGTTALELGRSGADVAGVISFHGGLATTMPAEEGKLKAKVLVLHGADDPFVSDEELLAFRKEMQDAKADWQLVAYGNAVHSFTNPANKGEIPGAMYNADADRRSWEAMKTFFAEIFGGKN